MARSLLVVGLLVLSGCSRQPIGPRQRSPGPTGVVAAAGPVISPLPLEPADAAGASSAGAVAIARLGKRTLAFVADADDDAVVTFDVDARQPVASTRLGARPSAVLVTPAGRIVALGADDARAHVLVMTAIDRPLVPERSVIVPDEPVSATLAPSGGAILVASRWGHALTVVPLSGPDAPIVIDLPRDPAAVVASSDGRRAFVVHAVGSRASVVDLASRSARVVSLDRQVPQAVEDPWLEKVMMPVELQQGTEQGMFLGGLDEMQGPAKPMAKAPARRRTAALIALHADQAFAAVRVKDAIVAPLVSVDTGADDRSVGYGGGRSAAVTPSVVSFDETGLAPPVGERVFGRCLLPRGATIDPVLGRLFVACVGSNQVSVLRLGPHGMKVEQTVPVPGGPVAVSVDASARLAVVWSAFSRTLSVLTIDGGPTVVAAIALGPPSSPLPADAARGRVLFNTNFEPRVSSDGRACASCHPDARDDGLAWSSPGGRRATPMLVERLAGTAPYGWDGRAPDFAHHLVHTTARLGGSGLGDADAADLQAYLATLHVPAAHGDEALVARGREVFDAEGTGCSGCHAGDALTDGDTHDVASKVSGDVDHAFDTPSLHLVAHSAPYFHDGRYSSLTELLAGSDGTMGHTSQLSPGDRSALEAYVGQL
jgi:DNA-binding beta-propeller fold protein YncE